MHHYSLSYYVSGLLLPLMLLSSGMMFTACDNSEDQEERAAELAELRSVYQSYQEELAGKEAELETTESEEQRAALESEILVLKDRMRLVRSRMDELGGTPETPTAAPPPDVGHFYFDSLQNDLKQLPTWAQSSAHGGIGATSFIVEVKVRFRQSQEANCPWEATLTTFNVHVFASSNMKTSSVLGLSTGIHELVHVRQIKEAWEAAKDDFIGKFRICGKNEAELRQKVKGLLTEWFAQFNANYTGKHFTAANKARYEQILGPGYESERSPREWEARAEQKVFRDRYGQQLAPAVQAIEGLEKSLQSPAANRKLSPNYRETPGDRIHLYMVFEN
ncbi:hypothetical protein [Flavilitoribacter nigricans]|uniref:Uncharacterized protein n=1 Tax=Flavilitoribacter nigricans (strain ATCC 23147 / DSM 23189 / NBRC 102662 / NCIMB 1420 / SS-2) TaxID=1122177 RepID=A0A2D0ND89_FLAN2|nr:hypothetical protein [Flavilitoribacter nigricans]PHN06437.1 hypothetical protein CRP01_12780 [Flavilitoribacter nigricans DSM 23189 = NBRC 102662]